MNIGQKSLLFGAHQLILHSILVGVAWRRLYLRWPLPWEWACIFIHDIGYWHTNDFTSLEARNHPFLGARIARRWFGTKGFDLVVGHSSRAAKIHKLPISKMCAADKMASLLMPRRLYLWLTHNTGELQQYRIWAATNGYTWYNDLHFSGAHNWYYGCLIPECIAKAKKHLVYINIIQFNTAHEYIQGVAKHVYAGRHC